MEIDYFNRESIIKKNPKSIEEYLSMFNIFREILKDIDDCVNDLQVSNSDYYDKNINSIRYFLQKFFAIRNASNIGTERYTDETETSVEIMKSNSLELFDKSHEKTIENIAEILIRHDRIESYLKWERGVTAYALYEFVEKGYNARLPNHKLINNEIWEIVSKRKSKLFKIVNDLGKVPEHKDALEFYDLDLYVKELDLEDDIVQEVMESDPYLNGDFDLHGIPPVIDFDHSVFSSLWRYLTSTEYDDMDTYEDEKHSIVAIFFELKHYLDIYKSDKNKYSKINSLNWTNKTIKEILVTLKRYELEKTSNSSTIEYVGVQKERYEDLLKKESKITSEFLKIDDNHSWYKVETNSSQFESFIGTQGSGAGAHCGAESKADVFFSLRTKNELGQFVLCATVAVKEYEVGEESEVKEMIGKPVYEVIQLKTRRNQPIPPRYWLALMRLFSLDSFVCHEDLKGSYGHMNDFNIFWLIGLQNSKYDIFNNPLKHSFKISEENRKMYERIFNKFVEAKPYWTKLSEAKEKFDLKGPFLKEFIRDMKNQHGESVKITGDELTIEYDDLHSLVDDWNKYTSDYGSGDRRRGLNLWSSILYNMENFYEIAESASFSVYDDESSIEDYLEHIKASDEYSHIYEKLKKLQEEHEYESIVSMLRNNRNEEPIIDDVYRAMDRAYFYGFEAGSSSSYYDSAMNYFDGLTFKCTVVDSGRSADEEEFVTIRKQVQIWTITFDLKVLDRNFNKYETSELPEFYIPKYDRENGIRWDWEYDSSVGYERLDEELYEISE